MNEMNAIRLQEIEKEIARQMGRNYLRSYAQRRLGRSQFGN